MLFSEVLSSLHQITEQYGAGSVDSEMELLESRRRIADLEAVLQMEKTKFEVTS